MREETARFTDTARDSSMAGRSLPARPIAVWLIAVAILIFVMIVVGGITRLTRSGLSIVEWNPVMGALPPLTEQQWLDELAKYRLTPEYRQVNAGMALDAFKRIYYVEWFHRLLGRLIGLVFFLPLVYFAVRRRIPKPLVPRLAAIFALGALQGALGWFMVQSGLIDVPRVSPYRLTAHLGLAVAIYAYIVWIALGLLSPVPSREGTAGLRRFGRVVTGLVCVMILAGGFVAGTRAGLAFNTFPLMVGHFVPPGLYAMEPWWVNNFENVATVQFNHRMLAYVLLLAVAVYWWRARAVSLTVATRRAFNGLLGALLVQTGLGIATLLYVVPVGLGALHQAGALVVLTAALYVNHRLRGT